MLEPVFLSHSHSDHNLPSLSLSLSLSFSPSTSIASTTFVCCCFLFSLPFLSVSLSFCRCLFLSRFFLFSSFTADMLPYFIGSFYERHPTNSRFLLIRYTVSSVLEILDYADNSSGEDSRISLVQLTSNLRQAAYVQHLFFLCMSLCEI